MSRTQGTVKRTETREEQADIFVCDGCGRKVAQPSRFELKQDTAPLKGWSALSTLPDMYTGKVTEEAHYCPACTAKLKAAAPKAKR